MSDPAPLVTGGWWRLLLERLGRQAAQTAVPILATVVSATGRVDAQAVAVALAGALTLTVLKGVLSAVAGVRVDPGAPLLVQLLDRAVPAAAGVAVGFVPVSASGLLAVDWVTVGWASLAAAGTAVLGLYATPPVEMAFGRHRAVDPASRDAGSTVVGLTVAVSLMASLLVVALGVLAAPAGAHPRSLSQPIVRSAWSCDGVLIVRYDLQALVGTSMVIRLPDGRDDMQFLFVGGRYGPTGRAWLSVHAGSGGDGVLRFDLRKRTLPTWDGTAVRTVRTDGTGITSVPMAIQEGCPA